MVKVLVVEDDDDLRGTLVDCLGLAGHQPRGVGSARDAYKALSADPCTVAIIDVGLPDEDGFSIARTLSGRRDLGIIILTARSGLVDRLTGFDAGADVYFVKPVDCRELALAVGNLGRRIAQPPAAPAAVPPAPAWRLDRHGWALVAPGGAVADLTAKEIALLDRLVQRRGQPVTRAELIGVLGYRHDELAERRLDAVVGRLRRKLEAQTGEGFPIKTLHAVGYVFTAPVELFDGAARPAASA